MGKSCLPSFQTEPKEQDVSSVWGLQFQKSGKGKDVRPGSGDKLDAKWKISVLGIDFMQDTIVGK